MQHFGRAGATPLMDHNIIILCVERKEAYYAAQQDDGTFVGLSNLDISVKNAAQQSATFEPTMRLYVCPLRTLASRSQAFSGT